MEKKAFYTTGETSRILGISRSTVWRRFDEGTLRGKRNPITGERLIDRESLEEFMTRFGLSLGTIEGEKREVLIVSPGFPGAKVLEERISNDSRVRVAREKFGSDALISFTRNRPQLLIIDESIQDVQLDKFVQSVRSLAGSVSTKILCMVDDTSRQGEMMEELDGLLDRSIDGGELADGIFHMLGLDTASAGTVEKDALQREDVPRLPVTLPADLSLYRTDNPESMMTGQAILKNISRNGAFLSEIRMDEGVLPGEPFRLMLEVDQPLLKKWSAHCRVLRLKSNGSLSAGLQFIKISNSNREKIERIIMNRAGI